MTPYVAVRALGKEKTMAIRFICAECQSAGLLPDDFPGGKIRCHGCKTLNDVGAKIDPSKLIIRAKRAEEAAPPEVGQVMSDDETYELEIEEAPPTKIKPPPRTPVVLPAEKEARRTTPTNEKVSSVPTAWIIGASIAGAAVAAGILMFLLLPSGVPQRPDAEKGREGIAENKAKTVTVADKTPLLNGNPVVKKTVTPSLSPTGAARSEGILDSEAKEGKLVTASAKDGPVSGEEPAKAKSPADQASGTAADPLKSVEDATVFLNVQVGGTGGSGTGFVIHTEGRTVLIATNDHVANPHLQGHSLDDGFAQSQPQPTITAVFRSGAGPGVEQSLPARIIASDGEENRDLAILEIQGVKNPPKPIAITDASPPTLLMPLLIYGFPFGNIDTKLDPTVNRNPTITVNRGSISSMKNDQFNRLAHIQIDGSINPGNSGGPVVDEKGRLVGISVAKIANSNIGFAIPAADLSRMLDGQIGATRLAMRGERSGMADLDIQVPLIDPMKHIQSVEFHYGRSDGGGPRTGPDAEGNWPLLPDAQTVSLNRSGATASATIRAPLGSPQDRRLFVQTTFRLDSGKLVRAMPKPYQIPSRPTGFARADLATEPSEPMGTFAVLGRLIDPQKQPVKDCKVKRDADSLTIRVPAGVRLLSSELDTRNAPMMLANVAGDFVAQVKVSGNMVPGTDTPKFKGKDVLPGTYQGSGLLLWQDTKNYILVERSVTTTKGSLVLTNKAIVDIIKGGKPAASISVHIPEGPLFLRLQRIDGALAFMFGPDGKRWITSQRLAVVFPPKVQVGLVACNMSKEPLDAQFEAFVLLTDKKDLTDAMKP